MNGEILDASQAVTLVTPENLGGVVPADVEMAVALRATHADCAGLEPRALAAAWTHAVTRSPGQWQPGVGVPWPRDDSPACRAGREDLEGRTRHGRGPAIDVENRFYACEPDDAVPRALAQLGDLIGTDASPFPGRHLPYDCARGTAKSTPGWRERVGIEPTEAQSSPKQF